MFSSSRSPESEPVLQAGAMTGFRGSYSDEGPGRAEERRARRKVSNRDAARRSRMRKKQQLEELTSRADRLRLENRALLDRLLLVKHHCLLFLEENDQLRAESGSLCHRLSCLNRVLALRRLQTAAACCGWGGSGGGGNELSMVVFGNEQTLIT